MSLSDDAKGIIKEIREQANNTRHKSDEYSIKALRQKDLSKFHDTFAAMQSAFSGLDARAQEQTEMARRAAELAELDEDERNAILKAEALRAKREDALSERDLVAREKAADAADKKDKGLFGKNGLFKSIFSGAFGLIKKALFVGITGSILYELTAGFLERFGVTLPTLAEASTKLGNLIASTDWEKLKKNFAALSALDVAGIASAVAGGFLAKQALETGTDVLQGVALTTLITKMLTPDGSDVDAAGKVGGKAKLLRIGVAGLVFSAMYALMDPLKDLIRDKLNMTKGELDKERVDIVDLGGNIIQGATLGLMIGGIKGAIVGALAGLAWTAAQFLRDKIQNDILDKGTVTNAVEEAVKNQKLAQDELARRIKDRAELGKDMNKAQLVALGLDDASIQAQRVLVAQHTADIVATRAAEEERLKAEVVKARERLARGLTKRTENAPVRGSDSLTDYKVIAKVGQIDKFTGEVITQEMIDTARREGRITKSAGGTDQINRQTTYAQTLEEDTRLNIQRTQKLRDDVERLEAQLRASNEYATNAVNEIRGNPQNISPSDDTVAGVAKKITTAMDNGGTGQVNVVIDAKDQSSTQIDSSTKSNIAPQRVEIAGGGSCGSSSNGLTPGGVMYG